MFLSKIWFILIALASAVAISFALIAVCYVKGEPPKWRWGGD